MHEGARLAWRRLALLQSENGLGESGGEEEGLTFRGELIDDESEVGSERRGEDAVGFIEDLRRRGGGSACSALAARTKSTYQELCSAQAPLSLVTPDEIHETTRSGNDDMRSLAKFNRLVHHVHPSHDDSRMKVDGCAQHAKLFRDLKGQLAAAVQESAQEGDGAEQRRAHRVGVRTTAKRP